jgi:7,8-dihydropterin-6-yl-methyl-4-(beta-D-ribofuranosyl)aminobenzene 5'-phosphate synthase
MVITVVYDNNPFDKEFETGWGFSCLLSGIEKTILFDTGPDGPSLLRNMQKLTIAPESIDVVVLSHIHNDHTGGLQSFLQKNPDVCLYLPKPFPEEFKDNIRAYGAKMVEVEQAFEICTNVYSTGRLGRRIKEQALAVRTNRGLVVITSCAHPGIVKIVNKAKDLLRDDIFLVMGGFHLEWILAGKVEKIVSAFQRLNVQYAAPCHCTGQKAKGLFEKHFSEKYIDLGAGKVITIADLK